MFLLWLASCYKIVKLANPSLFTMFFLANLNLREEILSYYRYFTSILKSISQKCETFTEILHNYRTGAISLQTLFDFILYKCRIVSTEMFENGLVLDKGNTIEIVYYLRDTRYVIVVKKNRGPRSITKVVKIDGVDITDEIRQKLGPYGGFHNIPTTPKMLGYSDGIEVLYRLSRSSETKRWVKYYEDDIIST